MHCGSMYVSAGPLKLHEFLHTLNIISVHCYTSSSVSTPPRPPTRLKPLLSRSLVNSWSTLHWIAIDTSICLLKRPCPASFSFENLQAKSLSSLWFVAGTIRRFSRQTAQTGQVIVSSYLRWTGGFGDAAWLAVILTSFQSSNLLSFPCLVQREL